jgi:putative inorganic carbon (hco3(-)) transporter
MTRALPSRALMVLIGVVAAVIVVAATAAFATRESTAGVDVFEQAAAALVGMAVVGMALVARPAWPLSIGLALGAFSGHWDTMGIPIALDRLFIGTAIVSTLIRARLRSPHGLRTRPVDWLLGLVAIYALGSALLVDTFQYEQVRFALLDRLSLLGFVLFFVAPKAFREERDRQVLLGTLVALGGYLGLTALFETVGPDALVVPDYISDPSVGTHSDRARGPFAEAAANGLVLYACLVASVIAVLTWRHKRWRQVAVVVAGLCALGILLTVTRAAWIAGGVATVVTLLAVKETRRYAIPAVAIVGAGVLIAFAAIPGLEGRAEKRADDDRPIWDRQNSNSAALRMISDKPLLGFGWGRFPADSPRYYRQSQDYPLTGVRNLHNVYLSNAVELGLIGGVLWLFAAAVAIVGSIIRRGPPELRPWKVGLMAWAICYALSALSTPLGYALPTLLLWTWAGIARGESASGT